MEIPEIAEIRAKWVKQVEDLTAFLAEPDVQDRFVVRCGSMYLQFEIEDFVVKSATIQSNPLECGWLKGDEAHALAQHIKNGAGERGVAVEARDAVLGQKLFMEDLIKMLDEASTES